MPGPERTYYTALELAGMFGVTRRTVYVWMDSGLLQYTKVGPKLRYVTPAQLERFFIESGRKAVEQVPASPKKATQPGNVQAAPEIRPSALGVMPVKKKPARRR